MSYVCDHCSGSGVVRIAREVKGSKGLVVGEPELCECIRAQLSALHASLARLERRVERLDGEMP